MIETTIQYYNQYNRMYQKKKVFSNQTSQGQQIFFQLRKKLLHKFQYSQMTLGQRIIKKDLSIKKENIYILKCSGCTTMIKKKLEEQFKIINHFINHNSQDQFLKVINYHFSINQLTFYLFFQQFPNSKLLSKQKYNEFQTLFIIKKIVKGIKYLQQNDMFMRNFSHRNIFINDKLQIKMWDLGIIDGIGKLFQNFCHQLPIYASPQFFHSSQYQDRSQSWTIGVILYEMLFGQTPFLTKPTKSRRNEFLKEIKIFGERIQKFGITQIQKKNTINNYWRKIFKNTLTVKDRRWSCDEIEKQLNQINQIEILKQLQSPEYNQRQSDIKKKYSDLRFFIKRGQLCSLYNYFLKNNQKNITNKNTLLQQKIKVFCVYFMYTKLQQQKLHQFNEYFLKKQSNSQRDGQFIIKLNSLRQQYSQLKQIQQKQEIKQFDLKFDDDMIDQKTSFEVSEQIQQYQKYQIKIKTLMNKQKIRLQGIKKELIIKAQDIYHILDLHRVEEQNELKTFLKNYYIWNQLNYQFVWNLLQQISKIKISNSQEDDRKASICFYQILQIIKNSKILNNSQKNYQKIKLNFHVLTYTKNHQTIQYLEKNKIKFLNRPLIQIKQNQCFQRKYCLQTTIPDQIQQENKLNIADISDLYLNQTKNG